MAKTIEQRVEDLEAKVGLLYGIVIEEKPYTPDRAEFDRAIQQMVNAGSTELLKLFKQRGGKIPKAYESPKKQENIK